MDWYLGTDLQGSDTRTTSERSSSPTPSLCSVPHSHQLSAVPAPEDPTPNPAPQTVDAPVLNAGFRHFLAAARENPGFRSRGSIRLWSLDHH